MMKKIVATSLVVLTLIISGCSDDGKGESKLAIQQMLDQGDYEGVIRTLGDGNNSSDYMLLGAAYMGKAGVALPDLIEIVIESTDSNNNSDSTFGAFTNSLSKKTKSNPTALADLQRSTDFYEKVIDKPCSKGSNLSTSEKDVCLFTGLSQTVKAATTLSYMADDLSALEGSGSKDSKLTASACAMEYANDGNVTGTDCNITLSGNVVFKDTNKTYESILVDGFEYLIKAKSPAVTNGFCKLTSFVDTFQNVKIQPTSENEDKYHVCPVDRIAGGEDLSMTTVLVDALNDGTGSIGAAGTDDTQESIDEFKCEVLGGTFNNKKCSGASLDNNVTESNVIDYLNKNNK